MKKLRTAQSESADDSSTAWKQVYAAVLEADAIGDGLYFGCREEVARARVDCQNKRVIELLTGELAQGSAIGEIGALDTTVIATSALEAAVHECKTSSSQTAIGFSLNADAQLLLQTAELVLKVIFFI